MKISPKPDVLREKKKKMASKILLWRHKSVSESNLLWPMILFLTLRVIFSPQSAGKTRATSMKRGGPISLRCPWRILLPSVKTYWSSSICWWIGHHQKRSWRQNPCLGSSDFQHLGCGNDTKKKKKMRTWSVPCDQRTWRTTSSTVPRFWPPRSDRKTVDNGNC